MARKKQKQLKRNKKDKIITGVIGGFSEYWEVDPTLLRIIWLILLSFTGFVPGIVAYLVASIVMKT